MLLNNFSQYEKGSHFRGNDADRREETKSGAACYGISTFLGMTFAAPLLLVSQEKSSFRRKPESVHFIYLEFRRSKSTDFTDGKKRNNQKINLEITY